MMDSADWFRDIAKAPAVFQVLPCDAAAAAAVCRVSCQAGMGKAVAQWSLSMVTIGATQLFMRACIEPSYNIFL
jgi:hypothetical protein